MTGPQRIPIPAPRTSPQPSKTEDASTASLLDKARKVSMDHPRKIGTDAERLALLLAWTRREITGGQVAVALGVSGKAVGRIMEGIALRAVRMGRLVPR